jgi:hypothetical protein
MHIAQFCSVAIAENNLEKKSCQNAQIRQSVNAYRHSHRCNSDLDLAWNPNKRKREKKRRRRRKHHSTFWLGKHCPWSVNRFKWGGRCCATSGSGKLHTHVDECWNTSSALFCGPPGVLEWCQQWGMVFDRLNHQEKVAMTPNTASNQRGNVKPGEI